MFHRARYDLEQLERDISRLNEDYIDESYNARRDIYSELLLETKSDFDPYSWDLYSECVRIVRKETGREKTHRSYRS